MKAPELLPELERYEPLASSYLKGLEAQQELPRKAGGLLSAENVGEVLRVSRQAIDKQRQTGKLIAIPKGSNGYGYPACQFEAKGAIRGLDAVLGALGPADGWAQLTFIMCANSSLDGCNPLDLLRAGQIERVVEAAGMFGEHGAL